jgi:molybdopterin-binding protein
LRLFRKSFPADITVQRAAENAVTVYDDWFGTFYGKSADNVVPLKVAMLAWTGPRLSYPIRVMLIPMTLSARNRIEGKVVEIQVGGVMAHVVIRAGKNLIESVITKRSVEEMKLKVGDKVSAVIKSTEVMLEKG